MTCVKCKMVIILEISILNEVNQTDKYHMISLKRIYVYLYVQLNHFAVHFKLTQYYKSTILQVLKMVKKNTWLLMAELWLKTALSPKKDGANSRIR